MNLTSCAESSGLSEARLVDPHHKARCDAYTGIDTRHTPLRDSVCIQLKRLGGGLCGGVSGMTLGVAMPYLACLHWNLANSFETNAMPSTELARGFGQVLGFGGACVGAAIAGGHGASRPCAIAAGSLAGLAGSTFGAVAGSMVGPLCGGLLALSAYVTGVMSWEHAYSVTSRYVGVTCYIIAGAAGGAAATGVVFLKMMQQPSKTPDSLV